MGILVFDQTYFSLYNRIINHCNKHNITTIAVPHGHNTFDNELIYADHMDIDFSDHIKKEQLKFKYVVYENSIISDRYLQLGIVNEQQIKVLGSTRFCNEWMKKLREILPEADLPVLDDKILKIVFMISKPKYNGHPEEVERTIKYISKFPDVFIFVKPHTRGMKFNMEFGSNVQIVDNDFHSPILIDWADVVLFTMTSVIFDCLKCDKPALYLRSTHSNKLLSERYFHSWEVHCRDDLREFIWALKSNKKFRTYSKEDRDKYCKECIEPNGTDVLGQYAEFFIGKLKN